MFLDQRLDDWNPGALGVLRQQKVDPTDAAYLMSNVIPHIISVEFNASASKSVITASLGDIVEQMRCALPVAIEVSKEDWLELRSSGGTIVASGQVHQHG